MRSLKQIKESLKDIAIAMEAMTFSINANYSDLGDSYEIIRKDFFKTHSDILNLLDQYIKEDESYYECLERLIQAASPERSE